MSQSINGLVLGGGEENAVASTCGEANGGRLLKRLPLLIGPKGGVGSVLLSQDAESLMRDLGGLKASWMARLFDIKANVLLSQACQSL